MNKPSSQKFPTMDEIIAQNPQIDLSCFRQWQRKNAELEAAGIDTSPQYEDPKPSRQQPIPFSLLDL